MSKSKFNEEKVRNRKIRGSNDKENGSKAPINSKSIFQTGAERSRIPKPHKRGRSGFFWDIGSLNQASKRQRQFYTPISLPTVIGPNETAPDHNPELFWGTYRPNVFFGMSHRSPHSMLFGLAWVSFDGKSIVFRHQCTNDGDLKSYNWIEHDGRNYGIHEIISGNHNITVAFVKRPNTPYGGDWTTRVSVSLVNKVSSYDPTVLAKNNVVKNASSQKPGT
nr:hypothetical transcript [Hymenolepis microstoma]